MECRYCWENQISRKDFVVQSCKLLSPGMSALMLIPSSTTSFFEFSFLLLHFSGAMPAYGISVSETVT